MGRKAKDNSEASNPGRTIRLKRLQLKLTLDQLAAESKVSKGSLSRIERGEQNFSLEIIKKIAQALKCEYLDLYPSPAEELFNRFQTLPPSIQRRIIESLPKKNES